MRRRRTKILLSLLAVLPVADSAADVRLNDACFYALRPELVRILDQSELYFQWFDFDPFVRGGDGRILHRRNALDIISVSGDGFAELRTVLEYFDEVKRTIRDPLSFRARGAVLRHLYGEYDERAFAKVGRAFKVTEETLYIQRMDFGSVRAADGELLGSLRAYDATAGHYPSSPRSPLEIMFDLRGHKVKALEEVRRNHPDARIYEMGNFLVKPGNSARRKTVKAALLRTWLERYPKRYPNSYYFAHVASEAHAKLYEREYGFKVVERIWAEDIGTFEMVLAVDAATLAQKLESALRVR